MLAPPSTSWCSQWRFPKLGPTCREPAGLSHHPQRWRKGQQPVSIMSTANQDSKFTSASQAPNFGFSWCPVFTRASLWPPDMPSGTKRSRASCEMTPQGAPRQDLWPEKQLEITARVQDQTVASGNDIIKSGEAKNSQDHSEEGGGGTTCPTSHYDYNNGNKMAAVQAQMDKERQTLQLAQEERKSADTAPRIWELLKEGTTINANSSGLLPVQKKDTSGNT
nr:uncharacterized protein LOC105468220 [Macaca nemestrina]